MLCAGFFLPCGYLVALVVAGNHMYFSKEEIIKFFTVIELKIPV